MEINQTLHHFRITGIQPVTELDAKLCQMEHEKTGARLVWLDRVSDNKTFGIAFRTIPSDDTGVFHILEHSVLNGSKNYPVKEPFVELLKGSMQTFLNAMTFPDKTFYPVSSRNDKDFLNLIRVYLDAVFFPAIYEKPEIFWQEGWHYELRSGQEPSYKGVVFNEMKGALASPDRLLQTELYRRMFPDTCYHYVSGGDPAHIPELSYEQFLASHRRFYHPSNSYIFLDGSIDLNTALPVIDEYVSLFEKQEMDAAIGWQAPIRAEPAVSYYEISPKEVLEKKARIAWGFGLGNFQDRAEKFAMHAMAQLLCGSNQAPLKAAILTAGLAEDMGMEVMDGTQQLFAAVSCTNVDENKIPELQACIESVIRRQISDGLDREHLRAILANTELKLRERDFGGMPMGVALGSDILDSWLYGGDPAANLCIGSLFEKLNSLVDTGWYEEFLEKVLLQNDHTCQVLLLPSHTFGQEKYQEELARLAQAKAGWDVKTLDALQKQQASLDAWQSAPNRPEDLACLPKLSLSDISEQPEDIPTSVEIQAGVPILRHELATGGISYWNLYFDISDLDEAELSIASFLCQLLGKLDTKTYPALELQKKLNFCIGSLRFAINTFSRENMPGTCRSYLCATFNALEGKLPQAIALVLDVLNNTLWNSSQHIQAILMQARMQMEQMTIGAGNSIGMKRVMAGVSAEGVVLECTGGYSYLLALREMEKSIQALPDKLDALCKRILCKGRLTLSITGAQNALPVDALLDGLADADRETPPCRVQAWGVKREGIVVPAGISFAVQGGLCPYSGSMQVVAQMASLAYLWNSVRVQGGAYGAGMGLADRGCGVFYSYRDPNAARSLDCFRGTVDFIRQIAASQEDLTGLIISTISGTEPVLLPGQQGKLADSWFFKGISYENRCATRKAILHTTKEDIAALAAPVQELTQKGGVCVVGSAAHVEACDLEAVYTL